MSSGLVKKARGRPPKPLQSSEPLITIDNPITHTDKTAVRVDSNRRSGSMSLRPNKRVKISKRELLSDDDLDDSDDVIDTPDEESDDDDIEAIVEAKKSKVEPLDPLELEELTNSGLDPADPGNNLSKRGRKKIIYHAKLAAKKRREQLRASKVESGTHLKISDTSIFFTFF